MMWIVTGATGLIGRHLVPALAAPGRPVMAWSRTAETARPGDGPHVTFRNVDLAASVPPVDGVDDVGLILLAAQISGSKEPGALAGLLQADVRPHAALAGSLGARLKHVVYASSCTVYGYVDGRASREDDPLHPLNAYAIEKLAAEFVLEELARGQGFALSILRIAQVYGPGAPETSAMYGFLAAAARGEPVVVTVGPEGFRDFVHVDDVVEAIVRTVAARPGGALNIGTGPTRIADVARAALRAAGRADEPQVLAKTRGGNMALDASSARQRIGWEPSVTVAAGVQREFSRIHGSG
jgi:UDP-glucose 4-epimerase